MSRKYAKLLIVTFCALIALPGSTLLIWRQPQPLPKVAEVKCPPFELSVAWLAAAEQYFIANFGQKRRLVQLHNLLGFLVVGDLQSNSVLAGRDGWLFLKQSFGWQSFRSEKPMTSAERDGWERPLRAAKRDLDRRKVPLLYVIAPSKETIHPEYLPGGATRARSVSRLDEMLPVLQGAGIEYLDLRSALQETKAAGALYDRLDSHWNGRGGEVAARLMLERTASLLGLPPEYSAPVWSVTARRSPNDLGALLALDEYLTEDSNELQPTARRAVRLEPPESVIIPSTDRTRRLVFQVADASLPKALILRDSFGTMLVPALAEKFRRSVWLWTRTLDFRLLDQEKPDIVIYEITERLFYDDPPQLRLPPKKRR
jgi:alginate O-acetyltransferase complex protein AlgJ